MSSVKNEFIIFETLKFIKEAHKGQKREGTNEPYWYHPARVSEKFLTNDNLKELINSFGKNLAYNESILTATIPLIALCHDTIEDTTVTEDSLKEFFDELLPPESVEELVNAVVYLTNQYTKELFPDMSKLERGVKESERLLEGPLKWQVVKFYDTLDNIESFNNCKKEYVPFYLEKKKVFLLGFALNNWKKLPEFIKKDLKEKIFDFWLAEFHNDEIEEFYCNLFLS
jgi:(p)ppGpp synthase/HD superfamily hydrolase